MITKYQTHIELEVIPTYHQTLPVIVYGVDEKIVNQITLSRPCVLNFALDLTPGAHSIFLDFINKSDVDCIPDQGLDKFVTIGNITINKICLPKFNWAATYRPEYPEPWYSQQMPPPQAVRQGSSQLGWNGRWQLKFDAPVFSWIHQLENMGWIWPTN